MLRRPDGTIERLDNVPRDKKDDVIQPKKGRILKSNYDKIEVHIRDIFRFK